MNDGLAASYAYCEEFVRRQQSNFFASFTVLPPEKFRQMCAIYAFMGYSDDLADRDGAASDKKVQLARWRAALDRCFQGEYGSSRILPAFHDTVVHCDIPQKYFHDLIDGAEMDLVRTRYETFDELYDYCYHVASVVGFACLHVWGFEGGDAAIAPAEACGIAFQITNILRDLKEDAARGRVYLPQEDLRNFGYSEDDLTAGVLNDAFREMMHFELDRARRYYCEAEKLGPMIDPQCRPCFEVMFRIYRALLDKIESRGFDVFSARVSLDDRDKMQVVADVLGTAVHQQNNTPSLQGSQAQHRFERLGHSIK